MPQASKAMNRYRFRANCDDPRPVQRPKWPWWCTGYGDDYATVVAYLPVGEDIYDWWPEAENIDVEPYAIITFSDRFRRPHWYQDDHGT
jgi:hypothetical protein